jgi:hypothetical protein
MKLSRWTLALYVGLVFASGIVVGAYSHRFIDVTAVSANARRNPEEFRKRFTAEMKSRLNLTSDEMTKLGEVLDVTQAEFSDTRGSIEPALAKIREEQHRRILEILQPAQQAEYENMRREREARARQEGAAPPSR